MINKTRLLKGIQSKLKIKGQIYFTLEGNSMCPLINSGAIVKIVTINKIYLGQVVLFYTVDVYGKTQLVLHRIVKIDGDKIWTKGDNVNHIDEYINEENLIGEYPEK